MTFNVLSLVRNLESIEKKRKRYEKNIIVGAAWSRGLGRRGATRNQRASARATEPRAARPRPPRRWPPAAMPICWIIPSRATPTTPYSSLLTLLGRGTLLSPLSCILPPILLPPQPTLCSCCCPTLSSVRLFSPSPLVFSLCLSPFCVQGSENAI